MDSDEEEMASMRASSRYSGSNRQPDKKKDIQQPKDKDSDEEDDSQRILARRKAQLGPSLGPSVNVEEEEEEDQTFVEEDLSAMRGFLPMGFGKQKASAPSGFAIHSSNQRTGRGSNNPAAPADRKAGVQFGPRVTDSAIAVGAKGRAEKIAQAKGPMPGQVEEDEDDEDESAQQVQAGSYEEPDELPEPGKESEVIPVSHEAIIPAHDKAVTAIALDPKGSRMITGSMDGIVKLFDFNGMSEEKNAFRDLEPVEAHMVQGLSFSTTGGSFLAVCSDSSARIYDRDGSSKPLQSTVKGDMYVRDLQHTKGHTQMLTAGMWHPFRQEHFLTCSLDGTLRIWDMKADPVGMDQQLPCIHVLKTLDKRNVCVGGGAGKTGGLYPTCCRYSPTDAKYIVGGCSDGSVQVFFDKQRFLKPDRILRTAHLAPVTDVAFVPEGGSSNVLVTRSQDDTMKVWDCRMLSDAKGPIKIFTDLPATHEKSGICVSPNGKYLVAGTSMLKGTLGAATLRVYNAKSFELVKSLDFGKKSILQMVWPEELNQLIVGTSTGEVVMLYSPFSSKKGAMHFVGKKAKSRSSIHTGDAGPGPIFCMTDQADMKKFYSTGHGNMSKIRRGEARQVNKSLIPTRPEESGLKMPDSDFGNFAALALKAGAKRLHLNSTRVSETDSQKTLLEYENKTKMSDMLVETAYAKTQPTKILDYSEDLSEGDLRMAASMKGEFCRKCGMKLCRCVDYSRYGMSGKKPRTS